MKYYATKIFESTLPKSLRETTIKNIEVVLKDNFDFNTEDANTASEFSLAFKRIGIYLVRVDDWKTYFQRKLDCSTAPGNHHFLDRISVDNTRVVNFVCRMVEVDKSLRAVFEEFGEKN